MALATPEPDPEVDAGRLADTQQVKTWLIIVVIALFSEVATLQYTMVSPAALLIAPHFPGVGANISWMTTIYGLVGGFATPLAGKISDLWGKKRVLVVSGAVFAVGSLICALSGNWALFLLGRGFQALSLGNVAVSYGLFRDLLPRRYVPIALGAIVTGFGLSAVVAPLLAGYVTAAGNYHSIFWFLAGYGVVTLALVIAFVPETRLRMRQRLDVLGALILSGGVALCLVYLSNGSAWGWASLHSLAYLAGGVVLLAFFVPVERRMVAPIIDMSLLFSARVSLTMAVYFLGTMAISCLSYVLPLMMQTPTAAQLAQGVHRTSALLHVGLNDSLSYAAGIGLIGVAIHATLFQGVSSMASGPGAGWLAARIGARRPVIVAFLALGLAAVSLLTTSQHGVWFYALSATLFGCGFGAIFACVPNLIIDAVPPRQQGISSGMLAVFGALATALATAVVTAFINANPLIMTVSAAGRVVKTVNLAAQDSLATWSGFVGVFWVVAGCAILGLVVALVMRHGRNPATGGLVSEEF
ncbi:MAG TPA: MFS transporter [Pseudonocardiaceae bacterium]|jgi:MFS family permease